MPLYGPELPQRRHWVLNMLLCWHCKQRRRSTSLSVLCRCCTYLPPSSFLLTSSRNWWHLSNRAFRPCPSPYPPLPPIVMQRLRGHLAQHPEHLIQHREHLIQHQEHLAQHRRREFFFLPKGHPGLNRTIQSHLISDQWCVTPRQRYPW